MREIRIADVTIAYQAEEQEIAGKRRWFEILPGNDFDNWEMLFIFQVRLKHMELPSKGKGFW